MPVRAVALAWSGSCGFVQSHTFAAPPRYTDCTPPLRRALSYAPRATTCPGPPPPSPPPPPPHTHTHTHMHSRDFTLQVVGSPVVVAGNSIGGFICSSLAADYPGLVAGLVLLNSAGRLQPTPFDEEQWRLMSKPSPPRLLVGAWLGGCEWPRLLVEGCLVGRV